MQMQKTTFKECGPMNAEESQGLLLQCLMTKGNAQEKRLKMSKEIWKPIPKYPLYEVSNKGNVRTKRPRNRNCKGGVYRNIALWLTVCKRYTLFMAYSNGSRKIVRVHVAMLEAFIGPRPDGMFSCHNDGNSRNNTIENLRWDTASANAMDQIKHGVHVSLNQRGEKIHHAKMTDKKVINLRKELDSGLPIREAEKKYGIGRGTIRAIKERRTWTHI